MPWNNKKQKLYKCRTVISSVPCMHVNLFSHFTKSFENIYLKFKILVYQFSVVILEK